MDTAKVCRFSFLLVVSLLFIVATYFPAIYAQDNEKPVIEIYPAKIEVAIAAADIPNIPNATVFITARQANLTRVSINSTDLVEEKNRRFWIPAESITSTKQDFDLNEGRTIDVELLFSIPKVQPPGSYVGKITVRDENGGLAEISVTIKLREDDSWAFSCVVLGVVASLIISMSRWHIESEDSTRAAIELADAAIYKAEDEKRKDYRYLKAKNLQTEYELDFRNGEYKDAKEKAIRAKFEAEQAKPVVPLKAGATKADRLAGLLNQAGPVWERTVLQIFSGDDVDVAKANEKTKPLLLSVGKYAEPKAPQSYSKRFEIFVKKDWGVPLTKKQLLVYLSMTIIVAVVMLQAWEAFYPRISDFGASTIDYVTAFLYGFSGQSFLGAFADLGKRWLA